MDKIQRRRLSKLKIRSEPFDLDMSIRTSVMEHLAVMGGTNRVEVKLTDDHSIEFEIATTTVSPRRRVRRMWAKVARMLRALGLPKDMQAEAFVKVLTAEGWIIHASSLKTPSTMAPYAEFLRAEWLDAFGPTIEEALSNAVLQDG